MAALISDLENRLSKITCEDINRRLKTDDVIYDNKFEVAKNVIRALASQNERCNHVILAASMQSGKTSVMNSVCNIIISCNFMKEMRIKKFIFITGMNDVKLKSQIYERAKSQILGANNNNICTDLRFATNESKIFLLKNSDLLKDNLPLHNSLIFIDETQFGTNESNKLSKFLYRNGADWKNRNDLKMNNIYIVSVSATPFNEMVSDTENVKKIINISKDENYIGISEFLQNDMLKEGSKDDITNGSIYTYIEEAYQRMSKETMGCGIIYIRTRDFDSIKNNSFIKEKFQILELCANGSNIDYSIVDEPIEKLIRRYEFLIDNNKKTHMKPIIVLLKEAFRAGVTIPSKFKDYIYMIYDYSINPETTAQALLGRMCGYRDITNDNWKRTYFYVNLPFATQYAMWEKDYSIKNNIPCDKVTYKWIDENTPTSGFTEIATKNVKNVSIDLTDDEIIELYNSTYNKKGRPIRDIFTNFLNKIVEKKNLEKITFDYICDLYIKGKNNYSKSSQIKKFESFEENTNVFKIRAEKLIGFSEMNNGRKEFNETDLGLTAIMASLDATIVKNNDNFVIGGNKKLLIYKSELAQRTKVADRKTMFKIHKCTNLKRTV